MYLPSKTSYIVQMRNYLQVPLKAELFSETVVPGDHYIMKIFHSLKGLVRQFFSNDVVRTVLVLFTKSRVHASSRFCLWLKHLCMKQELPKVNTQ